MFSTTKVMILLLTSLLIFLAIKLMDMDREGFRERFKAYKNGKSISEIYDAGLPKYGGGKQGFSATTKKQIDKLYKVLQAKGFDAVSAAGIIGNAIQESSLNPDSVNQLGYSGLFLNSKQIRKAIEDQYGDYSYDSLLRYLDDWTSGNTWIRKGKHRDYTAAGSGAFKRTGYKTAHEASDAFMKLYERPVIMKDGKIIGYLDWDKRRAYALLVHDYLTGVEPAIEKKPITQTTAAEYNAVHQFQPWLNYHLPDYPLNNPAPSSISSWNNPKSPAYTPAGLQTRRIDFGKMMMDMLEDDWEPPTIQPLKTVNSPDSKISTFTGFKNGKLPGYKRGKVDLGVNPTNATINDDGTFTDDYTKVWDDLTITPKGARVKNLYRYQEPWDDEKFLNAVTVGGLNNLSPALWIRRGYDLATGNLTADSWLNGNAGVVSDSYAKEHPLMSMAANGLVDFWTLGGLKLLKGALSIGTKLNPVLYTKYEPQSVQEPIIKTQIAPRLFEIEEIPGYQLKSLMRGNALEKQLSKQGTISVNSIKAHANKASEVEKSIINNILSSEEFAGLKSVDYNKFRRAVHNNLITYDRTPDARYDDYGLEGLGISTNPVYQDEPDLIQRYNDIITRIHDFELQHNIPRISRRSTQELIDAARRWRETPEGIEYHNIQNEFDRFMLEHPNFTTTNLNSNVRRKLVGHSGDGATLNTYTFSSKEIPLGNSKHYDSNTLGHSRTYTTETEPEVLHVMESLSDWGLGYFSRKPLSNNTIFDEYVRRYTRGIPLEDGSMVTLNDVYEAGRFDGMSVLEIENILGITANPLIPYLANNYTLRLIQENLKYAAERGLNKMRYPTPDTAAKIEGYKKGFTRSDETEAISKLISDTQDEYERLVKLDRDPFDDKDPINIRLDELSENLVKLSALFDDALARTPLDYRPEHKTILKKYADFSKLFKKLHKNAEVREVTDTKGNTWYEVDVPKDFLKKEWMYGISAMAVGGATATQLKPKKTK